MRRAVGVVVLGALLAALSPHVAIASERPPAMVVHVDLQTRLLMALFGETTDAMDSAAESYGERVSESPLRGFALRVALADGVASTTAPRYASDVLLTPLPALTRLFARASDRSIELRTPAAAYATDQASLVSSTVANVPSPTPFTALYRPIDPEPSTPPATLSFDLAPSANTGTLVTFAPALSSLQGYDVGTPAAANASDLSQLQATVNVPVHIGSVRFQGRVEGAQAQDQALRENALGAGANFDVRTGGRHVNVDVADRLEHVSSANTLFDSESIDGQSNMQLGAGNVPVLVPAYADVTKRTISTGVAVPLSRRLTLGVQYDTQHLLGGYGAPGLSNLDARNAIYGGNVTFALPHSAGAAITFSAKQYRYQDNLIPSNTFTQTREDVNFTVKF